MVIFNKFLIELIEKLLYCNIYHYRDIKITYTKIEDSGFLSGQQYLFLQVCNVFPSPSGALFNVHTTTIQPFLSAVSPVNGTEAGTP